MMQRILFVCLGNICRSPTAEGVLRDLVAQQNLNHRFEIDSAGTGDWHIGHAPDQRACRIARARGIDLSGLRARQIQAADFTHFDLIIGMDESNRADLVALAGAANRHKIRLLLEYGAGGVEVPDPYYGGEQDFEYAFDLIAEACADLLATLTRNPA